jgi:hypothetical protein
MLRVVAILFTIGLLLAGCETTKPIPEGYNGPVSHIRDSLIQFSTSGADIFYLAKINGKSIGNSFTATRMATQGRGAQLRPVKISRDIPASPITLTITGRRDYAAPIQSMFNKIYQVSGDVEFTPAPDENYVVKGLLGENYSAVWLEEEKTGAVIGQKFEVNGSATLGLLEK